MRFDSFHIPAFGPFTKLELQFKKSAGDLHVIYGANEAGKSSLLRAIHNLLYGIPVRSNDNFLHNYGKLLIGATVSDSENELTFFRKKGNQGTLLDAKQSSIDEGRLKAFCGSVNDEFFSHMFGLSTDSLRTGAAKLLTGKGELGTLLFSASLGGSPIDVALQKLQEEADQLFAGNGRKANSIVIANKAFKDLEKESRDLSTTANAWMTLQKVIKEAELAFNDKEATLNEKRQRASHLRNLTQAIPLAIELREVDELLASIILPQLPSDFPKRVRQAQGELSNTRNLRDAHELSISQKKQQLDAITRYQTIVDGAPDLDSLHQGINRHLEDLETHTEKSKALRRLGQQIENQLNDLGLDSSELLTALPDLRPGDLITLEELGDSLNKEEDRLKQAKSGLTDMLEELSDAQDELDGLSDVKVTPAILDLASRIADHAQDSKVVASQINEQTEVVDTLRKVAHQLGLADLEAKEIRKLPVPGLAILQELHGEREAISEKRKAAQEKLDGLDEKIIDKQADIEQTSGNIAVHTNEDLIRVREERDAQWVALASHLQDGSTAEASGVNALTTHIQKSDEIADALRNHAEILGKLATLNHDLALLTSQRKRENGIIERVDGELTEWGERWAEKSHVLVNRDFLPAELIEWRAQWENWCQNDSLLNTLNKKIGDHRQTEAALIKELRQHFGAPETSYGVLSRQLTEAIEAANSAKGERKVLTESIAKLKKKNSLQEAEIIEATNQLESTRARWSLALSEQRLDDPGSTKAAIVALRARRDARDTQRQIEDATNSLTTLADKIADFQKQLRDQRGKHLPDSPELDPKHPDLTEGRLWNVLEEARQRQTNYNSLVGEIGGLETDLRAKQLVIETAENEIKTLVAEAKLSDADGLSAAITHFEKRQNLTKQWETTHRTLVNLAGSSPVEDLIAEAEASESGKMQAELDQLAPKIDNLQQERDEARDRLSKEIEKRTELEKAKGGAIDAKQRAANELAKIVTNSERFIRLHHAIAFLKAQVEAYREKSQGPMIERTARFFATLTNGSFTGVAAQVDENDSQRVNLVALRQRTDDPDGVAETLHTTALSEGTRDQLYLALRLAAIDIHLENHAPMPLILDDILMTFDDKRAESVFRLLETLSKKTQVIIFTHHQHIAKQAATFVPKEHLLNLPNLG